MFEVRVVSPLDNFWEERDQRIYTAAGRKSDWSGASGASGQEVGQRDHGYLADTFTEAVGLKQRIEAVGGVSAVTIREK